LTLVQTDVLVAPKRVVKRFAGLTHDEVTDLFVSAQKVLSAIEREYNATSCTLAIQDGQDAGQTVEHVHLHIVPRRPGDFQRNDDVYDKVRFQLGFKYMSAYHSCKFVTLITKSNL
jgi:bis(5'-adenosyl)-triphosphatase